MQALQRVGDRALPAFEALQKESRQEPAVNADETRWWLGGAGHWLWVFATPRCTLYKLDAGRGRPVLLETLGADFPGVLGSDCLASYENRPYTVQKCYAHHLRAVSAARARPPPEEHAAFDGLTALLKGAMLLKALRPELSAEQYAQRRAPMEAWADRERAARFGTLEKVAARLRKRRQHLFTFLNHPGVEAATNRAERARRPAVVARQLSCGNKTVQGKRTFEILASLAAACTQRSQDFAAFPSPCLRLESAQASR